MTSDTNQVCDRFIEICKECIRYHCVFYNYNKVVSKSVKDIPLNTELEKAIDYIDHIDSIVTNSAISKWSYPKHLIKCFDENNRPVYGDKESKECKVMDFEEFLKIQPVLDTQHEIEEV